MMSSHLCGKRADLEGMDLGSPELDRMVSFEIGRAQERHRIANIIECEHAVDRRAAAFALALETDLPAADAIALLAKMPTEEKPRVGRLGRRA